MQFEVSSQPQTQFQIQGQNYEQLHIQTQQQTEIKAQPQIQTIPQKQPPYVIQGQYYIQPQQQLQPQYQIQVIQQNPNTLEINDSNWLNHMCCLLVWCFIWLIFLISSFYFTNVYIGYYSYLNILVIISVIFLTIGIITKKTILYKIGYYLYCVYAVINFIISFFIGIILLFFLDTYSDYIGLIPNTYTDEQQKKNMQSSLDVYKIIIIVALILQIIIQSCFQAYLKGKIKIFEAYELYARTKENRLIQQPNIN